MAMTASVRRGVDPLNPTLYALLEHKFGEVRIANAGLEAQFDLQPDPLSPGKYQKRCFQSGEYYTICCPFCHDQGHRLWVNYRYGSEYREKTQRRSNTHLAICYRRNCLSEPGRSRQFEDLVFGQNKRFMPKMAIRAAIEDAPPPVVESPGEIVPLTDLPADHPAVAYLVSRGFNPNELTTNFGVGVCVAPSKDRFRLVAGRIYIPVTYNTELVGWQARSAGEPKFGPKYFNSPGMQKSRVLYNFDVASQQPLVVIVEGVPSVWRIGAPAVCLFGKTMSAWQRMTIATTWVDKPVFLLLDNDAQTEIEQAVAQLCEHALKIVPVLLPDSRDPADYSRAELHELLTSSAEAVGVAADLSFLRDV